MSSVTATVVLAELIRRKHQVLSHLAALSRRQLEVVAEHDWTNLMKLLAAKGRLLDALRDTERSLDRFRDDKPEDRQWSSPMEQAECRRLACECGKLLAEVMQLERQGESALVRQRDETHHRLRGMHVTAEAFEKYTAVPWEGERMGLDLASS